MKSRIHRQNVENRRPEPTLRVAMGEIQRWFRQDPNADDLVASVLIIVALLVVRFAIVAFVRRSQFRSDRLRIRWLGATKRITTSLIVIGLLVVWGTEIRTFALSIAALAAGFVVAMREVILCVSGFFVNAAGDGFSIGDRIQVVSARGDVVDHGIFSTTLLEVDAAGRRTGQMVFVPNSLVLMHPVVNETAEGEYVSHTIVIPPVPPSEWRRAESALLRAGGEVTSVYLDAARASLESAAMRSGLPFPDAALEVSSSPAPGSTIELRLRLPVPARRRGRIERDVELRFLELFHERTESEPT